MKLQMILALLTSISPAFAAAPQADIATLRNLSGCFHVTYDFVEDGTHDFVMDSDYHEWIDLQEADGTLKLQHYGIFQGETSKHWREEWTYQTDGKWQQAVVGPFEDSRYTCASELVFNQWKCTSLNAPKPNRDRNRKDYQTLDRDTALQITAKGWIQNERNVKRDSTGKAVANEVGWIQYSRAENSACGH